MKDANRDLSPLYFWKLNGGAKRRSHLFNTAFKYALFGLFAFVIASPLFPVPSRSEEIKVKVTDLTREDFRVRLFLYERVIGRSIWTDSLQWSPRVATIWNELTDLYISHTGESYKRSSYMTDAVQVEGDDVWSSNEFYLKFKTWSGKEIGPFKYNLDYRKFAQEYKLKY